MNTGEKHAQQTAQMALSARRWRNNNPNRKAEIQFNFPPKVLVIGVISDALKAGLVSANEAGLELLKAMWPWGGPDEPTVLMVRIALEFEEVTE